MLKYRDREGLRLQLINRCLSLLFKEYEGLNELTLYRNSKPQDIIDVPINLKDIRGPEWPECVGNENMIMGGQSIQSSVSAIPKNIKKI